MKRFAPEPIEGLMPSAQRVRLDPENATAYNGDVDMHDDDRSDVESRFTEVASPAGALNTPITPSSPARRQYPSDDKIIPCTYPGCNKSFNRPVRLAAHLRSHTGERPFECPFEDCDKSYIEEKHLRHHIVGSHTEERQHACTHPGCNKKFTTGSRLRRHQQTHEGVNNYTCREYPPCDKTFRKHQTLDRHIRTEHLGLPPYFCEHKGDASGPICGQGFDTAVGLRRHQEREHGETRYWCDECACQTDEHGQPIKLGFATLSLLNAHMKVNHLKCHFCGNSFNGKEQLERHVEMDHAKLTANANASVNERKVVACPRPGCTKKFTKVSNLNTHIRSAHDGVKFICGKHDLSGTADLVNWSNSMGCGQGFGLKLALENHVRYVHMQFPRPQAKNSAARAKNSAVRTVTASMQDLQLQQQAQGQGPSVIEQLAGVSEAAHRTMPCTVEGCRMKFTYSGELEQHIQNEHRTIACTVEGCHVKFIHNGELEEHIQNEHRTIPCRFGCHAMFVHDLEHEEHVRSEHRDEQNLVDDFATFYPTPLSSFVGSDQTMNDAGAMGFDPLDAFDETLAAFNAGRHDNWHEDDQIAMGQQIPMNQPFAVNQQLTMSQPSGINQQLNMNQQLTMTQPMGMNQEFTLGQQA
ncbi:hypothetical protein GGR50DRAFT_662738 [Xylaria sp. CBS 124048]|nr:hypothetical protein GGR50DRAFT_662738 [Xylaria sp. CBS 124048]